MPASRQWTRGALLGLVILILVYASGWALFALLKPSTFAEKKDTYILWGQLCAGALVLLGLYLNWWATYVGKKGKSDERFGRASEQLSAASLGGILALEATAEDFPEEGDRVQQLLASYVRKTAPISPSSPAPSPSSPAPAPKPSPEVQEALRAIGNLGPSDRLAGTKLREKLQAIENWGISGRLSGTFLGKKLRAIGNLGISNPRQTLDLSGTFLRKALLARRANNQGNYYDVDLSRADLQEANLNYSEFDKAVFFQADLTGATLTEAKFREADFFQANLTKTNLKRADLSTAQNLENDQLAPSLGDPDTKLPPGLSRPSSWTRDKGF